MNQKKDIKYLVQGASVAAIYVALTFFSYTFGLANGVVQLRLSEALCILPIFTPSAIAGLFVGCLISNILTGSIFTDVIFGSIATLIGAIFTRKLRNYKILPLIPPILSNAIILPVILKFAYSFEGSYLWFLTTIFAGEVLSCGVLGYLLKNILDKYKIFFK